MKPDPIYGNCTQGWSCEQRLNIKEEIIHGAIHGLPEALGLKFRPVRGGGPLSSQTHLFIHRPGPGPGGLHRIGAISQGATSESLLHLYLDMVVRPVAGAAMEDTRNKLSDTECRGLAVSPHMTHRVSVPG